MHAVQDTFAVHPGLALQAEAAARAVQYVHTAPASPVILRQSQATTTVSTAASSHAMHSHSHASSSGMPAGGKERVHYQLDTLRGKEVLGGLVLHKGRGSGSRLEGGMCRNFSIFVSVISGPLMPTW